MLHLLVKMLDFTWSSYTTQELCTRCSVEGPHQARDKEQNLYFLPNGFPLLFLHSGEASPKLQGTLGSQGTMSLLLCFPLTGDESP